MDAKAHSQLETLGVSLSFAWRQYNTRQNVARNMRSAWPVVVEGEASARAEVRQPR